jgi:hypothetical protein
MAGKVNQFFVLGQPDLFPVFLLNRKGTPGEGETADEQDV